MRQLILKAPEGSRKKLEEALDQHEAKNTFFLREEGKDIVFTHLPNHSVNDFLESINSIENQEISLIPRGVINLYPPPSEAPDQVADVKPKSSMEIYLGGIQSVGSKFGLFSYSAAAGVIVWIGFYTSTVFLLVAAMLIAPYAGPAMNAALATAAGKPKLLLSSLKRYGAAMVMGIIASFLMSVIFPLEVLTPLMIEISHVSSVAILLPLVSGFAGAINVCQSERDSLVSGAAVGILVAASLAPPVGLVGAGIYLGDWEVVGSSVFRIILQLIGIHLSATLIFYFYGKVNPEGVRFIQGSRKLLYSVSAIVLIGIGAMMFWQFSKPPFLRKASMNTELAEQLNKELKKIEGIKVINQDVNFTDAKMAGHPIVNFRITFLPTDSTASKDKLKKQIISTVKKNIKVADKNLEKVFEVTAVTN